MRDSLIAIVILTGLVACEWNSDAKRVDASTQPRVDSRPMQDGDVDADPTVIGHLLLTEIALQPTAGELVEITNPTTEDISLADYYLADNGDYWRLPAGVPAFAASDFIIAFPAAATIPAGGSITIAMGTAAAFMTTYGSAPTYSIADATVTRLQGAGTPSLTDGGEIIALFHWDGAAGLVADVDIMIAGGPTRPRPELATASTAMTRRARTHG